MTPAQAQQHALNELGNPDPVGMNVYAPKEEEKFCDSKTTEET